jgi:predicted ester cyclase
MFPDAHVTIEDMIAEGDKVVTRISGTATHKGDLYGPVGLVPATNKKITWHGITISRYKDGKIIESWMETDNMGLMQQLGAVPKPN